MTFLRFVAQDYAALPARARASKPAEPCCAPALHEYIEYARGAVLSASRARAGIAAPTNPVAREHSSAHKRNAASKAAVDTEEALMCVQRLVTAMLARERR